MSKEQSEKAKGKVNYSGLSISLTPSHVAMLNVIIEHLTVLRVEPVSMSSAIRECILVYYLTLQKKEEE